MNTKLRIVSYNMLKGRSFLLRRYTIEKMSAALHQLQPDILLLQEFPGKHPEASGISQTTIDIFRKDPLWYSSYGMNSSYKKGDHGNAIFSRFPILISENIDISAAPFARRGLLHCELDITPKSETLHVLCAHLDLLQKARNRQVLDILKRIRDSVPHNEPFALAGDFNDWNKNLDRAIRNNLSVDYFPKMHDKDAVKTYPSTLPFLALDRFYSKGLEISQFRVPTGPPWKQLSDHLPIIVDCEI